MNIDCTMYEYALREGRDNREIMNYYKRAVFYDGFLADVDALALYLCDCGIGKGDSVAMCLPNIPNAIIAFYAINKIGAIANIVHPLLPSGGLSAILDETPCKAILINDVFYSRYKRVIPKETLIIRCSMGDYMPFYMRLPFKFFTKFACLGARGISWTSLMRRARKQYIETQASLNIVSKGNDIAVFLHSGGTTGDPKTVMLSNKALNAVAYNINSLNGHNLKAGTSMLMVLPMFHVFGLGVCMHSTMSAGARALMLPYFKAKATVKVMRRERVTFVTGVPQMYAKIIKEKAFYGEYLRYIKYCYCGGDKLNESIIDNFKKATETYQSKCVLSEGYGLTEAGICTVNTADNYAVGSVGAPIGNVKIKIIDANACELPTFERGEVCVGGDSIMSGYYNAPVTNKQVFVTIDGEKFLRTGDIGYVDEKGRLFFADRIKRMVKISGVNVFPSEIEREAERLKFVEKAVAIGKTTPDNKSYVKLCVKIKDGASVRMPIKRVRDALESELMRYAVPREIVLVDNIPFTALGKVDYNALDKQSENKCD